MRTPHGGRLKARLAAADEPPPLLHSGMAELYRSKVTDLGKALEHPESRSEATESLRGLIDAIVLTPNQGELQIELKGNLAAMLGAAPNAKRSPETGDLSLQVVMVAWARDQHYLQLAPRSVRVRVRYVCAIWVAALDDFGKLGHP